MSTHAAEVTARLQADEEPFGLALNEAICPVCCLAYMVTDRRSVSVACLDCHAELIPVPA